MSSKFVIVGAQRTGTTLIRTSLGSHPEIFCLGEAFKLGKSPYREPGGYWHYTRSNYKRRLQSVFMAPTATAKYLQQLYANNHYAATGFKLMLSHCLARPYIWPLVKSHGVKAIWINRQNVLKTLVSRRAAARSGVYHVSETVSIPNAASSWRPSRIEIDTASLLKDLAAIELEALCWKDNLQEQIPYLAVNFEDYVKDKEKGNQEILAFLGVRSLQLASGLEKVNPDDLRQIIDNFEEVAAVLKGTKYERHLDNSWDDVG